LRKSYAAKESANYFIPCKIGYMDKNKSIELIMLEVLGCLDENDRKILQVIKETEENFPWKVLADFQNLSALLPSILKVTEVPSPRVKEVMVKNLSNFNYAEENIHQPAASIPEKSISHEKRSGTTPGKNKIDWGSLSSFDSPPVKIKEFKEVKSKPYKEQVDIFRLPEIPKIGDDEEFNGKTIEQAEFVPERIRTPFNKKVRYVLISIIFILMASIITAYIHFNQRPDLTLQPEETVKIEKVQAPVIEDFIADGLVLIDDVSDSKEVSNPDNQNITQSQQNVLPKAPPKLPDPIEAPLIEAEEVFAEEETIAEEEISITPPKEIVEATEEPTYFVAVEEMPQPIGGLQGIQQMIKYPEIAKRAGIEGKVFVRAYVDETGNVTNAEIVKGIGGGCDEAAMDAILKTKFTPGKQRGKPIKVQVTIPVVFKR
jgi:periplasmic protein TonB